MAETKSIIIRHDKINKPGMTIGFGGGHGTQTVAEDGCLHVTMSCSMYARKLGWFPFDPTAKPKEVIPPPQVRRTPLPHQAPPEPKSKAKSADAELIAANEADISKS